jgi:hypothetical protein
MLFAVGAGPQVVGVSSYDDFPPETKALPRVGALLDPDTERILSLRPDLVVVYGSQSELEGQFTRAGIRVYPYRHGGIDSILQAIRDVAGLTGHPADGDRVIRELRSQLDAVSHARPRTAAAANDARHRPRRRTLRGVYVSGGIGFLHELLDIAGGDDVFGDIKREAVQPSNETMIVRAPEVIMELHPGEQPPADLFEGARRLEPAGVGSSGPHRTRSSSVRRLSAGRRAAHRPRGGSVRTRAPSRQLQMKILLSWSSGKDSAWALHLLNQQYPGAVSALLTTVNEAMDRVAMHGVRRSVLEAQARAARTAAARRAPSASVSERRLRSEDARGDCRRDGEWIHARGVRRSVPGGHSPV